MKFSQALQEYLYLHSIEQSDRFEQMSINSQSSHRERMRELLEDMDAMIHGEDKQNHYECPYGMVDTCCEQYNACRQAK